MRSALGCAALGALLLVVAGTFDAEPLYVTGAALLLLGAGALAWIGAGSIGAQLSREIGVRSVIEEQPLQVELLARPAGCRSRPVGSTSRCCPSRCACPPAVARRACGSRSRSAAAAAASCRRPPWSCATRSGWPSG